MNSIQDQRAFETRIIEALNEHHGDDTPDTYQIAVNPDTNEVVAIDSPEQVPDGWIYEELNDLESDTVAEVAGFYFDVR